MKLITILLALSMFSAISFAETIRLSEPVSSDTVSETFGAPLNKHLPSVTVDELAASPSDHIGQTFQVELPITKVCQKKGCFFIAQTEQRTFRVSFKDYGFFIPTDASGKTVLLNGELIQKELTRKQAAHFNSDLKANADSIKSGVSYEIVADSVRIPRT